MLYKQHEKLRVILAAPISPHYAQAGSLCYQPKMIFASALIVSRFSSPVFDLPGFG
jgi:hypothetical protein